MERKEDAMTYLEYIKRTQQMVTRLLNSAKGTVAPGVIISQEQLEQISISLMAGLLAAKEKDKRFTWSSCFDVKNEMTPAALDWNFAKGQPDEELVWLIMDKGTGKPEVTGPFDIINAGLRGINVMAPSHCGLPVQWHIPWDKVGETAFFTEFQAKDALYGIQKGQGPV